MNRDFLKDLGIADEETVKKIMDSNGVDVEKAKGDTETLGRQIAEKDTIISDLKGQIEDTNTKIQSFVDMDIDGIKKEVEDWKTAAKKAKEDADSKVSAMQFDYALEKALNGAKAKDNKSVMAHIDKDNLIYKDGELIGLDKQLDAIKENHDYLFNDDGDKKPPYFANPNSGGDPIKISREDFKKMGYADRAKIKSEQPEIYKELAAKEE